MYKLPDFFQDITEPKEAIESLAQLLSDRGLINDYINNRPEDFFVNIEIFCDRFNIPFSKELWSEIIVQISSLIEEEESWSSSSCSW